MLCNKCGKEVVGGANFCNYCGNSFNNNSKKFNFDKKQKIIIISLLSFVVLLLLVILSTSFTSNKNSRTIMIYIVGSNLETDSGIVTADLNSIKPDKIDLENTNILIYTGGTLKWHNFVSNKENGIYILKSDGFQKLETLEQLNMGSPNTLSDFINYAYDNYKADKYDLILYDHGGAIDGAIYDDISNDNLSLTDMKDAIKNTPFNNKNKLDAVLFRTCLNGTLEIANIFSNYSNYLIASEEVSYGSNRSDVLGFLNNINNSENGAQFGLQYLDRYKYQMDLIDPFGTVVNTYSVIDLSKIDEVNKNLDEFISNIDIKKDYNNISKVRNNIYQYGSDVKDYDMIDLYDFAKNISDYSNSDVNKLLNSINNAVVYNNTNETNSHGLSIYFPYKGSKIIKANFLNIYKDLDFSKEYSDFITKFYNIQNEASSFSFDISKNNLSATEDKKEVTFKLSKEQLDNFAGATYTVFLKDKEHPDYYYLLYNSNDYTINDDGLITTKINGNMLMINTEDEGYKYIRSFYRTDGNGKRYNSGVLYKNNLDFSDDDYMSNATLFYNNDDNDIKLSTAKLESNNERIDGILLDLDDYSDVGIYMTAYRILDENNNVMDEWENAPITYGYEEKVKDLKFKLSGIDDKDNEYYCVFAITDINNNVDYSNLIRIGE